MVKSKINDKINYIETIKLKKNDIQRKTAMYKIQFFDKKAIIALGEINDEFNDKRVLYMPIYLIIDEDKMKQIGVYEFHSDNYSNLMDNDGDVDIIQLNPIFYNFVDKAFLTHNPTKKELFDDVIVDYDLEEKEKDEDGKETEERDFDYVVFKKMNDDDIHHDYVESRKKEKINIASWKGKGKWINHFFKNNHYDVVDVPSDGNCFFTVVEKAYKSLFINMPVKTLRKMLVDDVKESDFKNKKKEYVMYLNALKKSKQELELKEKLKKELIVLRENHRQMVQHVKEFPGNVKENTEILKKIKNTKKTYTSKKAEYEKVINAESDIKGTKELLEEYRYMEDVETFDDFKEVLMTRKYWADSWSIEKLQLLLNVKFIILDSFEYGRENYNNVLQCGDFVNEKIEKKGVFNPMYYILLDHTSNHYKMIVYKGNRMFRFHELPYGLRNLILDKCMIRGKTIYRYIPKFVNDLKKREQITEEEIEKINKVEKEINKPKEVKKKKTPGTRKKKKTPKKKETKETKEKKDTTKCTKEKIKICEKKEKVCNETTGRCNKVKPAKKSKPKK